VDPDQEDPTVFGPLESGQVIICTDPDLVLKISVEDPDLDPDLDSPIIKKKKLEKP
jgi:hypothetical protein